MFSFCRTVSESSKASLKDVGCGAAELYSVILRYAYNIYTPLIDRNEEPKTENTSKQWSTMSQFN